MTRPPLIAVLAVLSLLLPTLAPAQSDACREFLMRHDELRQLYARGDSMALRVPPVPALFPNLTAARVYEVARHKLQAGGLYDPDAPQWLEVSVNLDSTKFAIQLSLRRWVDDIGYGLPGESTVWGLGNGGTHDGNAGRVLAVVSQDVDEFIRLYIDAQRSCAM